MKEEKVRTADFKDEVKSWDSMKEALRLEDRIRFRDLIDRASKNMSAMKIIKEEYQTEAFLLLLIIEQRRELKRIESKLADLRKESNFTQN
jgi:ferritin